MDGTADRVPHSEEVAAESIRRLWIRRASVIVVLSQGLAFAIGAILPTTPDMDRTGLIVGAALVGLTGLVWFFFLPRDLFGPWRVFIASVIAQIVLLVALTMTGGLGSHYFPYYLLPSLVMVMAGSGEQTLALGGLAVAGLIELALVSRDLGGPESVPDLLAIRLLQVGAFSLAATASSRAMGAIRDGLAAQTRALAERARTDPLTGLANRQVLVDGFARMLSTANRRGVPVSVVALDLDGMKAVNDRHGHAAGDRLLVHFANLVRSCGRGADLAVRAGGDEFILLLPDTDRAGALRVVQRLRDAAIASGPDVRFSAGVATSSPEATVEWLLALADDALYAAKATRSDGQR